MHTFVHSNTFRELKVYRSHNDKRHGCRVCKQWLHAEYCTFYLLKACTTASTNAFHGQAVATLRIDIVNQTMHLKITWSQHTQLWLKIIIHDIHTSSNVKTIDITEDPASAKLCITYTVHSGIYSMALELWLSSLCWKFSTWFTAKKTENATRTEKHLWLNSYAVGKVVEQVKWFTIIHVVHSTIVNHLSTLNDFSSKCHVINCATKLNVHCLRDCWLCCQPISNLTRSKVFNQLGHFFKCYLRLWVKRDRDYSHSFLCYPRSFCIILEVWCTCNSGTSCHANHVIWSWPLSDEHNADTIVMYTTADSDICAVLVFVVQCEVEIILCLLKRVPRIQPDISLRSELNSVLHSAQYILDTPVGSRDSTPGLPPGSRKPLDSRCQTQHSG